MTLQKEAKRVISEFYHENFHFKSYFKFIYNLYSVLIHFNLFFLIYHQQNVNFE